LTDAVALLGFILASASALLAVSAMAYSLMRGGFPFYDPLLMRIFGVGGLLSLGGLVFGVGGAWRAKLSAAVVIVFLALAGIDFGQALPEPTLTSAGLPRYPPIARLAKI